MLRFFQNIKVKKFLSVFLLTILLSNYLPMKNSEYFNIDDSGNSIEVNADSNDRRVAWIKLSQGKKTTEIDEIKSIDQESLRVIALFLSNYYVPFSTVLAGTSLEYKKEDGTYDEEGMTQYQRDMVAALKGDLGFDEEAAKYIVGLTVESSLKSCQMLFVTKSDMQAAFSNYGKYTMFNNANAVGITVTSMDDYLKNELVKTVTSDKGEMVSLSYTMMLSLMDMTKNETTGEGNHDPFDIYWVDNGIAKKVFSTDDNSVTSYLIANGDLNYKKGIGSAFMSATDEFAKDLSDNSLASLLSPFMMLYVDWVGDIIVNIGSGAVVLLPGCHNTYTFDYITTDATNSSSSETTEATTETTTESTTEETTEAAPINTGKRPVNLINAKGIYDIKTKAKINPDGNELASDSRLIQKENISRSSFKNLKATDAEGNPIEVYTYEEYVKKFTGPLNLEQLKQDNHYRVFNTNEVSQDVKNLTGNKTVSSTPTMYHLCRNDLTLSVSDLLSGVKGSVKNMQISAYMNLGSASLKDKKISDLSKSEFLAFVGSCYNYSNVAGGSTDISSFALQSNSNDFLISIENVEKYDGGFWEGKKDVRYISNVFYISFDAMGKIECLEDIYINQHSVSDMYANSDVKSSSCWYLGDNTAKFEFGDMSTSEMINASNNQCTFICPGYSFGVSIKNKEAQTWKIDDTHNVNFVLGENKYTVEKSGLALLSPGDLSKVTNLSVEVGTINTKGYQYYCAYPLFTLTYARIIYGNSGTEWDDKWFGVSDNRKTLMQTINGDGTGSDIVYGLKAKNFSVWKKTENPNKLAFWSLTNWANTHGSIEAKKKGKYDKYEHLLDKYVFNGLSEILYYDTLEEINEDTNLSDLFKVADVAKMISGVDASTLNISASDNWETSLESATLSSAGNTNMQMAVSSLNKGSNSKFAPCIFYTYVWEYFNKDATSFSATENIINAKLTLDNYPQVTGEIDWNFLTDTTNDEILSFIYYFLHPTKGIGYVATWFKNKISGILLHWHEDIVGSSYSNSSTGMTRYLGFTGYVTIPTLNDISWVSKLLANYNSIIIYLIIIMSVIMLCYVLMGSMTVQRGILGVMLFAIFAFAPPFAINTVVNATNTVNDSIYSAKFDYWALVQMQQYIIELDEAKELKKEGNMNAYADYIISNYTTASTADSVGGASETFYGGVKLKWISPKKYNEVASLSKAMDSVETDASYLKNILLNSVANNISGENYIDSNTALYLYRDYLDIYRYASCSYNLYTTFNCTGNLVTVPNCNIGSFKAPSSETNSVTNIWSTTTGKGTIGEFTYHTNGLLLPRFILANSEGSTSWGSYGVTTDIFNTSSLQAIRRGFLWNTVGYTEDKQGAINTFTSGVTNEKFIYYNNETTLATSLLLNYTTAYEEVARHVNDFNEVLKDNTDLNLTAYNSKYFYGIDSIKYNFGVQEFMGLRESATTDDTYNTLSYYYYGLYTESPFYFFSFNIQDQLNAASKPIYSGSAFNGVNYRFDYDSLQQSTGSIKNLFLGENQKYFFNLENTSGSGYGELRDFMNMHDLFYYIIPILRQGTDLAVSFDDYYGMFTYDSCPLHVQSDGKFIYGSELGGEQYETAEQFMATDTYSNLNEEEKYQFWHDYNVVSLFNAYAAWIDVMLDCDYAKSEKLTINGEKFIVEDPLDPTTYFKMDDSNNIVEGRYMVFSRSEMKYYNLTEADLTTVENKIIKIQDAVYNETLDLMNYYTLSDETLIHAYAMIQLFEFNKEFSQTKVFGNDYVMYPQAYELKAFTYDAYLRLILAGSTGEDLMSTPEDSGIPIDETEGAEVQTNSSIYERILNNTSLFFGIVMLIDDFLAVYVLPAFKLFFLVLVFLSSVALIIAASIKLETPVSAFWNSLLAPMLSFAAISIGMAWIVSKFMSEGAQGVVKTSELIELGDPTMVIVVMTVVNVVALVLYYKILRKCTKDFMMYAKAIASSVGGAIAGAVGAVVGMAYAGKQGGTRNTSVSIGGGNRFGRGGSNGSGGSGGTSTSAEQRGRDNDPKSGKNGLGAAVVGGAVGAGVGSAMSEADNNKEGQKLSKYNAKAMQRQEKADEKNERRYNSKMDKLNQKEDKINKKGVAAADRGNETKFDKYDKKLDALKSKKEKLNNRQTELNARSASRKAYINEKESNNAQYTKAYALKKNAQATFKHNKQRLGDFKADTRQAGSTVATNVRSGANKVGTVAKKSGKKVQSKFNDVGKSVKKVTNKKANLNLGKVKK